MKLLSVFILIASLHAAAETQGQTVTLSFKSTPLEKVFKEIERQTGIPVIFLTEMTQKLPTISVNVQNVSLQEAMRACLSGLPFTWEIENGHIVVEPAPNKQSIGMDVRGRVTTERGEPISAATVAVKGNGTTTLTNEGGLFNLRGVDEDAVLIVSTVGYRTREIPLNKNRNINIELSIEINNLDETMVIGYGNTTKRYNTGSVGKLTSVEIARQPVSNPLAAMQGRIPGVLIVQNNGMPGSSFSVLIRGRNSIQRGTEPLYIVDGVPFNSEQQTQRSVVNANNPLNVINPADIESIEVLKDADATAIYGSRGANGVILITTKQGSHGKTKAQLNYATGWGIAPNMAEFMNTSQYVAMRKEALANDGVAPTPANAYDLLLWDTTRYTDWENVLMGGTARFTNLQIRLTGGDVNTNFSIAGNYNDESTVFPGNLGSKRYAMNSNLRHRSTDKKFSVELGLNLSSSNTILGSGNFVSGLNLIPNAPALYDSIGRLNFRENNFSFQNPLATLAKPYITKAEWVNTSAGLSYNILHSLTLKVTAGYNLQQLDETSLTPIYAQDPAGNPKGTATFGNHKSTNWIVEPQISYVENITPGLKMSVLAGASYQQKNNKISLIQGNGYINDATIFSTAGAATITANTSDNMYKYAAGFGRINFIFDKKYILNLTGRRDGSSRFGTGKRYSNFGAIGAAWIFSDELLISQNFKALSFGKLRASFGIAGNDQIGDYMYLDTWSATTYAYQGSPGFRPTRLFNPNYSWEKKKNLDIGIELGFFANRIVFAATAFQSRSNNQLINYTLPAQTGFTSIILNRDALVQNRGLEISLSTINLKTNRLSWESSFNISWQRNKLIRFPGLETSSYASSYSIGKPLSIIRGYQFTGVNAQTGLYEFQDNNGDGLTSSLDYVYLGTTDPRFFGGLQNTITWNGIEVSVFFQFVNQLGANGHYSGSINAGSRFNMQVALLDRWRKPGDISRYQRYSQSLSVTSRSSFLANSNAAYADASYIRLKNLSVAYQIPEKIAKKMKLGNLRVHMQGQNLLTLSSSINDPESQDVNVLPPLRQLLVGIQINL